MDQGNFTIDWKEFREASPRRFKDLVTKEDFSDVTLVSGDGHRLPAHQVILATGCFFFKNLLEKETACSSANQRPLIFLRGVAGGLLEPLLQFLYTGSAQICICIYIFSTQGVRRFVFVFVFVFIFSLHRECADFGNTHR